MSEAVTGLSPEQYRAILAESIKTAGNMLINNAEAIVGNMNSLVGLTIKFDFDSDSSNVPEMTVTKSHYPEYQEMTELLEKHNRIIEGTNDKKSCDFLDPGSFLDKED